MYICIRARRALILCAYVDCMCLTDFSWPIKPRTSHISRRDRPNARYGGELEFHVTRTKQTPKIPSYWIPSRSFWWIFIFAAFPFQRPKKRKIIVSRLILFPPHKWLHIGRNCNPRRETSRRRKWRTWWVLFSATPNKKRAKFRIFANSVFLWARAIYY